MKKSPLAALAVLVSLSIGFFSGTAWAQVDLSGNWVVESSQGVLFRFPGPFPDDFAGIPINQNARRAGMTYNAEEREELNRQCQPWSVVYWLTGPWGGRFSPVRDRNGSVIGWYVGFPNYDQLNMTIWTDGRLPPPSTALHTYNGFTAGVWEGNTLHTTSTSLKDSYLTRHGLPLSNQATFDMFLSRHGDEMTLMGVVRDPVYLEAPWVLARTLALRIAGRADDPPQYCQPGETEPGFSDGYHVAVTLPPQEALQAQVLKTQYDLPRAATDGGARTMYPEFAKSIAGEYKPPSIYCKIFCCMPGVPAFGSAPKAVCPNPTQ